MAFVSFWHLPLHEFSALLQVVVLKFNQCSFFFFFLSLGCVVTGSPVISTLAAIWCKCAKLSSQCANEPSLEAKGYEHRARLIDFTVLSRTAFCPKKKNTHTHKVAPVAIRHDNWYHALFISLAVLLSHHSQVSGMLTSATGRDTCCKYARKNK